MIALLAALLVFLPFAGYAVLMERAELYDRTPLRSYGTSYGTWRS